MRPGDAFVTRYRFALTAADHAQLQDFAIRMGPLLPNDFRTPPADVSAIGVALRRFSDAVLRMAEIEGSITSGITCLEALFLKTQERTELAHKLSLRVASLLRFFGLRPLEVQEHVHQAYEIRSSYIHGGAIERGKLQNAETLCKKVLDYARMCVVVLLQIQEDLEKDEFINKLDRALLEEKAAERLRKLFLKVNVPGTSQVVQGAVQTET